jgi:outer membrane receptor protein involved in Fe transport
LKSSYSGYPGNVGLPDGAARIRWNASGLQANSFVDVSSNYTKNFRLKITDYVYPAALWYFVSTPLKASNEKESPEYDTAGNWDGVINSVYAGAANEVQAGTQSVALNKPAEYGVGRIETKITMGSGTFYDGNGKEVAFGSGYTLKGMLIGGQSSVGWDFTPKGDENLTIYDRDMASSSIIAKPGYTTATANQTLALETKSNQVGDYVQSKKQRMMEGQMKAILSLTKHSTTIVGADWRKDYLTATSGNIDQHVYSLAAYAQHEISFQKDFTATFGLRLTHHETFDQHLTPKATLKYAPGNFCFRATYSAGFRAPGLDELYYHYFSVNRGKAQISFGNQNLKPEKSHYISLNAEYRTQAVAFSLTGYINRINDMVEKQNIDVDDATRLMLLSEFPEMTQEQADKMVSYALYQNRDQGDVKGLLLNTSMNLFEGFNLSANYAYTYARSKSDDEWTVLDRSIRHTATIAANYHRSWRHYELNVNLSSRLQSKTYYTGNYEEAPGHGVWNLHTTHRFDIARLVLEPSLGIDNIFNKVDRRIDSSTRKYALYSPGRMMVAGLKIQFK